MTRLEISTPADDTIVFKRHFAASVETVFAAFTDADIMIKWYGSEPYPITHAKSDLRVGGTYRMVWTNADGDSMGLTGTYDEVDPPHRITSREIFDEDWTGGETNSIIVFEPVDGGTLMTMTIIYSSQDARDGALATPMAEGLEASFVNLDKLLLQKTV